MDVIKKAYIYSSGDPSVGIQGNEIIVNNLSIDPDCFYDPDEYIEEARGLLVECFSELEDEPVVVIFDYEMERIQRLYKITEGY